jgi:uncharacterized protein
MKSPPFLKTLKLCQLAIALTLVAGIPTASAQNKSLLILGTATPGGGFPVYGDAFAKIVNASSTTLVIETRNTKGSIENIPLLEEGKLDIALVAGEPAFDAIALIKRLLI